MNSSLRRIDSNSCDYDRSQKKWSHFVVVVVVGIAITFNDHVATAQPTVRIPDAPSTAISPMAPAPVLMTGPTATIPAPSVVIQPAPTPSSPTTTGGEVPSIQLGMPTVTPTATNVALPTINSKSPSSSNSTTITTTAPAIATAPSSTSVRPSTSAPTITFQPTQTLFPTITASPTSAVCNICTTGQISTNDVLQFENGNVTCVQASESGIIGGITSYNCGIIQELLTQTNLCSCVRDKTPSLSPTPLPVLYPECNICGDGYVVSNTEGNLLTLGGNSEALSCGFVSVSGMEGILSPDICTFFMNQTSPNLTTSNPCGCIEGNSNTTVDDSKCYVCGNETERVTFLDKVITLPEDVIAILPMESNTSLYTCQFMEESGLKEGTFDRLVCSFLQMIVSDECGCQVRGVTPSPATAMITAAPSPNSSPTLNNNTTSASSLSFQQRIVILLVPLLYNLLW